LLRRQAVSKQVDIVASDNFMVGEDKTIYWDVVDINGVPQNMTGWTLGFTLRRAQGSGGTALLTKTPTVGNGDATGDRATLAYAAADTKSLAPGTYAYSMGRIDSGSQQILAYGKFVINPVTTRVA
jgi:hypothetical protein